MDLKELAKSVHRDATSRGKYAEKKHPEQLIMDVVVELTEAVVASRNNKRANMKEYVKRLQQGAINNDNYNAHYNELFKNTLEAELADALITILSISHEMGVDIQLYFNIVKSNNKLLGDEEQRRKNT